MGHGVRQTVMPGTTRLLKMISACRQHSALHKVHTGAEITPGFPRILEPKDIEFHHFPVPFVRSRQRRNRQQVKISGKSPFTGASLNDGGAAFLSSRSFLSGESAGGRYRRWAEVKNPFELPDPARVGAWKLSFRQRDVGHSASMGETT